MPRRPLFPGYFYPLLEFISGLRPSNGLEIGYGWGESARAFVEGCPGRLLSIDIEDHSKDAQRLDRVTFVQGDSADLVPLLAAQSFDYIYIDGDHSYEAVKRDTGNCIPLLRSGGTMVWDDYDKWPGVKRFLDERFGRLSVVPNHDNGARWLRFGGA